MRIIGEGEFMQYDDFYEIEEIGSGGYGTVYTAKHKIVRYGEERERVVVLKKFKNFDKNAELFISEVSIDSNINYCIDYVHESDFNLTIIHYSHLIVQKSCQVHRRSLFIP